MVSTHGRIALLALLIAFGAAGAEVAAAKTNHRYSATLQSAPVSTANGYPAPGGVAVLAGSLKSNRLGDGAVVDHVTVTGQSGPNVFSFKGTEVDYYTEGTVRNTLTGTATVQSDGSQEVTVTGRLTGGTGRYRGATGRYTFAGTLAAGSSVLTGHSSGSIAY